MGGGTLIFCINILVRRAAVVEGGHASQPGPIHRQEELAGGHVRKGGKGAIVGYADRFTPEDEEDCARGEDREARTAARRLAILRNAKIGGDRYDWPVR